MKETIAEYARIILIILSFAAISIFIFGGVWFNRLGDATNEMENEIHQSKQTAVLEQMENRERPTLEVQSGTYTVGRTIYLRDNILAAYTVDEDGTFVDLKTQVEITCDSADYDKETETLTTQTQGVHVVNFSVKDDFGLKTIKTIRIVIENKLH